ncbi:Predicted acyl-CoA transferases/carnitine dehydratase [Bordetella pertussis]|nr:Predicted acyl-CoA transferases/carnitine dehydratase [Bordetella pertussis]
MVTGIYASTAILGALEHRNLSGEGQAIDISLIAWSTSPAAPS